MGTSGSPGPDSAGERLHGGNTALLIAALLLASLALRLRENAGIFIYQCMRLQVRSSRTRAPFCSHLLRVCEATSVRWQLTSGTGMSHSEDGSP